LEYRVHGYFLKELAVVEPILSKKRTAAVHIHYGLLRRIIASGQEMGIGLYPFRSAIVL
jgi:hypothetical protein